MQEDLFGKEDVRKLIVAGSDEAGRGPLAGPVVAATVILPDDFPTSILNDSKKLSKAKREEAENVIKERALSYGIYSVSPEIIDQINILQASLLAMKESYRIAAAKIKPDILLVDGNKEPNVEISVKAIVKGDTKIPEIMAASILAKCHRDRIMEDYDRLYPGYGFSKHKGYPTKEHYEALKKYGPTPIHRFTFGLLRKEESKELSIL